MSNQAWFCTSQSFVEQKSQRQLIEEVAAINQLLTQNARDEYFQCLVTIQEIRTMPEFWTSISLFEVCMYTAACVKGDVVASCWLAARELFSRWGIIKSL